MIHRRRSSKGVNGSNENVTLFETEEHNRDHEAPIPTNAPALSSADGNLSFANLSVSDDQDDEWQVIFCLNHY